MLKDLLYFTLWFTLSETSIGGQLKFSLRLIPTTTEEPAARKKEHHLSKNLLEAHLGKGLKPMEPQKDQNEKSSAAAVNPPIPSCRKKKSEDATFLEDLKDHIDEFIHASMDEHKSCFKKTINKMFRMSKVVADRNSDTNGVESSLPLRTSISE